MAKTKDKKITLEEALVPVDGQPYQVPANWCWVRLDAILYEIKNGTTIKQDKNGNGYFITRIESLQNQTIDFTRLGTVVNEAELKEIDWYKKDDIALSHINSVEHVGKTALITSDMLPLVHGMNLLRLRFTEACVPKLFQYYSQSFQYKGAIVKRINMAVNQVSINQRQLGSLEFPLAPLSEQQRIVECIESLFAKLDEAKEKAQAVIDGFETRKAAILHKAFVGELTARWRTENARTLGSWRIKKIDEICEDIKVGIVIKPSQYYTDSACGTPAFRSANVRENYINNFDWVYLNVNGMKENRRSIVHTGDVLIVRSGNPGTACVVTEEFDGYSAIDILIAVPDQEVLLPEYLCLFTNSPFGRKTVAEGKRGMALAHFNVKSYSKVEIQLPLLDEQKEIIHILQKLMSDELQAKEAAEAVIEQIDIMKKAILARAFRGELGTNNSEEESSIELLKAVLNKEKNESPL